MTKLNVPEHVAIIMDGNGRWARNKGFPRIFGHRAGMKSVRRAIEYAYDNGIGYLTLFAFSIENWGRPREEVDALMGLLKDYVTNELEEMVDKGIRINVIGDISRLSSSVREKVVEALRRTKYNRKMTVTLALSYSGRDEIVRAVNRIAEDTLAGRLKKGIDEGTLDRYLDTGKMPDPDLLIRTSGEQRISNFMLWQLAYTEIYITEKLWPQFTKKDFDRAIREFSRRKRRFGLTEEQVGD